MHVAFVFPNYWPYVRRGAERLMAEYAQYLVSAGHSVDIITSKPGASRVERHGRLTVYYDRQITHPVLSHYVRWLRFYTFTVSSLRRLMQGNYDVVHTWLYPFGLGIRLASHMKHTPYLYHVMSEHIALPYATDRWVAGQVIRPADHVAALSARSAENVTREMGVRASVLPPSVDLSTFQPVAARHEDHPRVLFVSDMRVYAKGLNLLLMAWDEIHRRRPEAMLTLAGPSGQSGMAEPEWDPFAAMSTLVKDPSARAAIEVLGEGNVHSLPDIYARASVTVLPSIGEAFGLVLVESLACGTPVVGSSFDGPGEIITDPGIGASIPLETVDDLARPELAAKLAEAVLYSMDLTKDPSTVQRCREHARRWDRQTVGALLETIYTQMIENRALLAGAQA